MDGQPSERCSHRTGFIGRIGGNQHVAGAARISTLTAITVLPFAVAFLLWFATKTLEKLDRVAESLIRVSEFMAIVGERTLAWNAEQARQDARLDGHDRDINDLKTRTAVLEAARRRAEVDQP